jgi:hypothetical protein
VTLNPQEAADDSRKGYDLAVACLREMRIRRHKIQPRPDNRQELRWWLEGEIPVSTLETVR